MIRSAPSPSDRPRHRPALAGTAGVLALALAGCSLPSLDTPGREDEQAEAPLGSQPPDLSVERITGAVEELEATLRAGRDALGTALEAEDATGARAAGEDALAALVEGRGSDAVPPSGALFPETTGERGAVEETTDRFTATLTVARDSGPAGSELLDVLRDPLAGDLGAWQRDAAGVLTSVEETVAGGGELEQLEADVGELPGLGTRAIAWTLLLLEAPDAGTARAYAERGQANLDVVLFTLEQLREELGTEDPDRPTQPGVDEEPS